MRWFFLLVFLLKLDFAWGQTFSYPAIKNDGQSIADFIPGDWTIRDSVSGNFNDNQGCVIILQSKDSGTISKEKEGHIQEIKTQPRILIILFRKSANSLQLIVQNNNFILTQDEPEMTDPYQSIKIENGVIYFDFTVYYGPSAYSLLTYAFQFRNREFKLIGADTNYFNEATRDSQNCSFNFLTKKWNITEDNEESKRRPKKIWHTIELKELKTLKNFNQPDTWEVTKGIFL